MNHQGLIKTDFTELTLFNRGKVRDVYETGQHLLIVATDRISAFDVIMPNPIPGKGKILTGMSVFWFNKMRDIIENHLISTDPHDFPEECLPLENILRGRSMLVKKAAPLPVECVVRGYLSGSGWKDYRQAKTVSGIRLPDGLKESSRLPEPIFTPSTKAPEGQHDAAITKKDMGEIIGHELTEKIMEISLAIYRKASKIAEEAGIIIDVLLTPDSSRFWPKDEYVEGKPQRSYDKQFLRDYLLSVGWNQRPPAPELPDEIIEKTRQKYDEALLRLVQ